MLRPLPVHEPENLVWIANTGTGGLSEVTSRSSNLDVAYRRVGSDPQADDQRRRSEKAAVLDPKRFGLSPVEAIPRALQHAGLSLGDIDLIELNEAFAAQYIACEMELDLDRSKVNVNGGAIALGHPVAATGSKILTTLLYALKARDKQFGCVSLCIGGATESPPSWSG